MNSQLVFKFEVFFDFVQNLGEISGFQFLEELVELLFWVLYLIDFL